MMRSFRSELIRIWRPAFLYGGIGLLALFAALVSVFIFTSAKNSAVGASGPPGQGRGSITVAELASPGGFLTALSSLSRLAGVVLLALWAIAMATDYSTGLIRILVQANPRRMNLLAGKIAALGLFTLLAATATTIVVVAVVARPLARLEGIEVDAWKTNFAFHLGKGFFDFTVAAIVYGLIGLMLAELSRSSAIAIGVGFLLVVESLTMIVASGASSYLPGGTLDALVSGGNDQLSWGGSLGLAVLYGLIAAGVSLTVFRTRDIVS